ncbi:MAG: DNA-binding response regulator, partial [Bacteroidia bacterium]
IECINRVETFTTVGEFLMRMKKQPFDFVLMDISLRVGDNKHEDGLEVCKVLKNRYAKVKVLIFSEYESSLFIYDAYKNADGFLRKSGKVAELQAAIDKIMIHHEKYFDAKALEEILKIKEVTMKSEIDSKEDFTDREMEVRELICEGNSDKTIGNILNLSPTTIKKHRQHILRKIHGHKSIEIIIHAIRNGFYKFSGGGVNNFI